MELAQLAAYAEERYAISELHKWADFPGFSVLADPQSGKWLALLMRQWDTETGEEIQRCDIKCGRELLSALRAPYLSMPFRMKGVKWVGVRFGRDTQEETVRRLFDAAVAMERQRGYTVIMENRKPAGTGFYRATALPFADPAGTGAHKTGMAEIPGRDAGNTAARSRGNAHASGAPGLYAPGPLPPEGTAVQETLIPGVPERIREMMRLYRYGDNSFDQKVRNFVRQGAYMADYEDDVPWKGEYNRYFPAYHDLNLRQLRGYFTWRTKVRRGVYEAFPASLAYIYLYELLNGIGADGAEDSLRKLRAFETGFLDAGLGDNTMRRNLRRWMREFAVVQGVPPETARKYLAEDTAEKERALTVLKEPAGHADGEIVQALGVFAGKRFPQSPVLADAEGPGEHLFAMLWRSAAERPLPDGRDVFRACFGTPRVYEWHPLANALWLPDKSGPDTEFVWDVCRSYRRRGGIWYEVRYEELFFEKDRLHSFLREADRQFRRALKTGHYLREKKEDAWAAPYAAAALEQLRQERIEAARPKITIDLSGLEKIRRDAMITTESLLTAEETGEAPAGEPAAAPVTESAPTPAAPAQTGGSPAHTAAAPDDLYGRILRMALRGESAAGLLREQMLPASVAVDAINESYFDEFGDSILTCDGEEISVVEDYREDLEQLLGE